jgi:hypothetical protein
VTFCVAVRTETIEELLDEEFEDEDPFEKTTG